MPIMLELCSMLLPTYYAQNHAGIISAGLTIIPSREPRLVNVAKCTLPLVHISEKTTCIGQYGFCDDSDEFLLAPLDKIL